MLHNLKQSPAVFVFILASMVGCSHHNPPKKLGVTPKSNVKFIKIGYSPKSGSIYGLDGLPNGSLLVRVRINSEGRIEGSTRIYGYEGIYNQLQSYLSKFVFRPIQIECSGPWTADLDIGVSSYTQVGQRIVTVSTRILSDGCTNTSHNCAPRS